MRPATWFSTSGTLSRGRYLLAGMILVGIKHNLDRLLARRMIGQDWSMWNYFEPLYQSAWSSAILRFYLVLAAVSIPFIWMGVGLTVRRLRDAGLPLSLVILVFIPFVKLLAFLALCVIPPRLPKSKTGSMPRRWTAWLPSSRFGAAALAAAVTSLPASSVVYFGAHYLQSYALGIFVGLPFCMGLCAALLASVREPIPRKEAIGVACLSVAVLGLVIFAAAIEGLICLAMAAPLAIALACLGGQIGYQIQSRFNHLGNRTRMVLGLWAVLPACIALEKAQQPRPTYFDVETRVAVAAQPEQVWKNVVEFSEIEEPPDWIFRAGIAYPRRARIVGNGVGSVRYCEFSTGPFVEPIEVWDPPRRLRFSVTENPSPMEEWTYRHIEPPHLRGFLVSRGGEFRLSPIPGGGTMLVGATSYRHSLWPEGYWRVWSDFIIHKIHRRVLDHIRREAERFSSSGSHSAALLVPESGVQ